MKAELELEAYKSSQDNMGIVPAASMGKPRDAHGDGWNDAVIGMSEKVVEIKKWLDDQNLSEGQQLKIAELLSNEWMMIYAFRPDMPMHFMVNWSDYDDITNLTMEDIDSMHECFLRDKGNQEAWVKEYLRNKAEEKS